MNQGGSSHCTPHGHILRLKKKVSCAYVLSETVNIINFVKSQPLSMHLFKIQCDKIGGEQKHFCCKPKYESCLKENHLRMQLFWVVNWVVHFFHGIP